jgi:hypothetical protein
MLPVFHQRFSISPENMPEVNPEKLLKKKSISHLVKYKNIPARVSSYDY